MFEEPTKLALGLFTGIVFGFLLQKGRAAKFEVIVRQLLLRDWTVVKIMGTAVVVGAVGVYALAELGEASLQPKPARFAAVLAGAVLFGAGMAVLGYCPGTTVAACGEGRKDAVAGVLGMLTGAAAYVTAYPSLQPLANALGDWGKVTLPELWDVSPWLLVAALVVAYAVLAGGAAAALAKRAGRHPAA